MSIVSELSELNTDEILELVNEIYEYVNNRGNIADFPKLNELYTGRDFHSERVMINSYIIPEAERRFHKVVPLLLKYNINEYLK